MNNVKKTWEGMNRIIEKSKVCSTVQKLWIMWKLGIHKKSQIILTIFPHFLNDIFSTVAEKVEADLPQGNYVPTPLSTNSFLHPVSLVECIKSISSLNNTTYGIHNNTTKLLKSVKEFIALLYVT